MNNSLPTHGYGRLDAVLAYAKAQPKWFVYALKDQAGVVVYVGASTHPEQRYKQHCEAIHGRLGRWQRPLRQWVAANHHSFCILSTHPTKRAMLDEERDRIAYIRPRFNTILA